ncbi:MAG: hypothetical protein M3336_00775 [Chloroflexota bacterium]|nr:hypothetical protein [Chloroflexota bacterium]
MPEDSTPPEADYYQVRVQGQLDPSWSEWLGGLEITWDADGASVLSGALPDQAALHGLLARVRDLGLPLLALERLPGHPPRQTP